MSLWNKVGLMTINEHRGKTKINVEEMNKLMAVELEKRNLQVDEVLGEIAKWRFDPAGLVQDKAGMTIILEVPRSLVMGMVKGEPDLTGFALMRVTHLLQVQVQKAVNQLFGGGYGNDDAAKGSYL
jgi:hypothetical protein